MTGEQFDALAKLLRLRAGPASAAARLVLVDGLRPAQAATRTGCSPQSASNTLAACRKGIELARRAAGIQAPESIWTGDPVRSEACAQDHQSQSF